MSGQKTETRGRYAPRHHCSHRGTHLVQRSDGVACQTGIVELVLHMWQIPATRQILLLILILIITYIDINIPILRKYYSEYYYIY